jgi:hypothetical protein
MTKETFRMTKETLRMTKGSLRMTKGSLWMTNGLPPLKLRRSEREPNDAREPGELRR